MFACMLAVLISWGQMCAAVVAPVAQAAYSWVQTAPDKGYLYDGPKLVGCWNGYSYFKWDGKNWVATDCPTDNPYTKVHENFGLDLSKIQKNVCSINGKACDMARGYEALAKGSLADDSNKMHLTVYGEGREGVIQDLERSPNLAEFKGKFHVQSYAADNWAVKGFHAPEAGKPTILVQWPDGTVVHTQRDYLGGSAELAEALRRVPDYKDKDLRSGITLESVKTWLKSKSPLGVAWWVVLATVGVIYFLNKEKKSGKPQ